MFYGKELQMSGNNIQSWLFTPEGEQIGKADAPIPLSELRKFARDLPEGEMALVLSGYFYTFIRDDDVTDIRKHLIDNATCLVTQSEICGVRQIHEGNGRTPSSCKVRRIGDEEVPLITRAELKERLEAA